MSTQPNLGYSDADMNRAIDLVQRMVAIPGKSGEESEIIQFIIDRLCQAGRAGSSIAAISTDRTCNRSPIGGQIGNLVVKLAPSSSRARSPRRMFTAHVDTVPICVGCCPKRRRDRIVNTNPQTGLGADNRTGAAVLLATAENILRHKLPHPPLTFFWPVQEEIGLYGVRHANLSRLGKARKSFNFDGGSSSKLTVGATGAYRMTIVIEGIASHAGVQPEQGVSAITIAGLAISALQRGGWLGAVRKRGQNGGRGTSNIGAIQGGAATNVVTNHAELRAEVRSHNKRFRKRILDAFCQAFRDAARRVKNTSGRAGRVRIEHHLDYEGFTLPRNDPSVKAAEAAIKAQGDKPVRAIVDGGLDANWLYARGIPTVTLGAGQENAHTVDEALNLYEFRQACCIALRLAVGED